MARIGGAFSKTETINLTDLADVTITSPADNNVLTYDVSTGEWINQAQSDIDHGSLSGLGDQADHTWALTVDGSRALTANWDAGSFKITAQTLESDIATGTAPLVVASTTVVSNLNADQVDGKDETAFILVDGTRAFTGNQSFGDFNITNVGDISLDSISSDAGTSINVTLGTGAGDDFIVGTNKLVIEGDTGNVGVGTTSPSGELDIVAATGPDLYLTRNDASISDGNSIGQIQFAGNDPTNGVAGARIYAVAKGTWSSGVHPTELRFAVSDDSGGPTQRMVIDKSGNVGIGTTGPGGLLHIYSSDSAQATFLFPTAETQLVLGQNSVTTTGAVIGQSRSGNEELYIDSRYTGSHIDFRIGGSDKVTIDSNGNVGIGTTGPDTILDINGALTFREKSADPSDPDEGSAVLWMSDGTGTGDDGDILMKVTAGATTKTVTLFDFSAGS